MWPLKTILGFVLFWVGCLAAVVNPIWGAACYVLVYQIDPVHTWWGGPLAALGIRYSLCAMAFTLIGMVVARRRVPHHFPSWSGWEIGLLALVVVGLINTMLGVRFDEWAQFVFEKFWKMMVFVMVVGRLASSRANFQIILWALVVGSLYLGYDAYTAPSWEFAQGRLNRVGGPDFSSTSGLAAHMSAMLPLIAVAFLCSRHWMWRLTALLAGALSVNAIVLCRTRSAFIGLAAGTLVALLCAPKAKRYRIYCILALGAVAAFSLTDNYFWARMSTLADGETLVQEDVATRSRLEIWKTSGRMLLDHPAGVGVGNFTRMIGWYDEDYHLRASHNTVILCFTELGVQGGIIFLGLVAGSLWHVRQCSRLAPRCAHPVETMYMSYGLLIAFATYFVTGLGTERLYCESYWWMLMLPVCLHRIVRTEIRELEAEPELARHHRQHRRHPRYGHEHAPALPLGGYETYA